MRRREEPTIFFDDQVHLAAVNALCDLLESKDERASVEAKALLRKYGPQLERDLSLKPALQPALVDTAGGTAEAMSPGGASESSAVLR